VSGGVLYTGVASIEEGVAADPSYPCCKARGSVVAVSVTGTKRGQILWKTYTIPPGYSGGGVWGSNFVIDKDRGSVYASTGNNYAHPTDPAYVACVAAGGTAAACTSPANHVDSILALDLKTGAIKWASKFVTWSQQGVTDGTDDWNVACLVGYAPGEANCPTSAGPDYDFASAPNLITYTDSQGKKKTILGAGQKSGIFWALNAATGAVVWSTVVGPGGTTGGIQWGTATDGTRFYMQITNSAHRSFQLANGGPTIDYGSWAALDVKTGRVIWQVADPTPGTIDPGAVSVANGVMYAGSYSGTMYALNAATGAVLFGFASGGSVIDAPSIVNGTVFWGSGYRRLAPGTGNNKVFAFGVK